MHRTIGVILTCHNRRDTTVACLGAVLAQSLPSDTHLSIFLVDDGSTDGTGKAIQALARDVRIIRGDGSLFWNGGMRLGMKAAMDADVDFALWLNDDTILHTGAISSLLGAWSSESANGSAAVIVVGSTKSHDTGVPTYGGVRRVGWLNRVRTALVPPAPHDVLRCDTMNGNCVLIPRMVYRRLGNLDAIFVHSLGDFDYGFRARAMGISLALAPGFVGVCDRNPPESRSLKSSRSVNQCFRELTGPKMFPPAAWATFCRRHGGPLWPLVFVSPYAKRMAGALWQSTIRLVRQRSLLSHSS